MDEINSGRHHTTVDTSYCRFCSALWPLSKYRLFVCIMYRLQHGLERIMRV